MPELLNNPALIPSLIGFLAGVVFTWIFAATKGKIARSVVLAKEKVAEEKLAAFQSKISALETEISTLRSSESRFLKHQGELEALAKADTERREEMLKFLAATQTTLQDELKKQELTLKNAINEIQPVQITQVAPATHPAPVAPAPTPVATEPFSKAPLQDDRDFVPLQSPVADAPAKTEFEGFAPDPNITKAESAANALRAALEEGNL
jgi:gas vesicle protein